ncbi:MAG: thioesterase family protein [Pseudomonadota bacterium]
MSRPEPPPRSAYRTFRPITTRWMDNDVYGHVNNVVYYSFFDTVVSGHLLEAGVIQPGVSPVIGLAVNSHCNYFSQVSFPDRVTGGLRVDRIGNSSVQYGIGIFRNDEDTAAASGHFTHVYVDAASHSPVSLPTDLRAVLEALLIA